MEAEVSIVSWINDWRKSNGLSGEEKLTEKQAQAFVKELKENFAFTSEVKAKTLIVGKASSDEKMTEVLEKYGEGEAVVIDELDEIKLVNSNEFKNALSAAVGEEWFERIYNGQVVDNKVTGTAFEDEIAIRNFVYGMIVNNSSVSEIIAMVASTPDIKELWNNTLVTVAFGNENIEEINGVSKGAYIDIFRTAMEYLGYSATDSIKVINEYVEFISTAYTDNNLVDMVNGESNESFYKRVLEFGLSDDYKEIVKFNVDFSNFKADVLYFLGDYGDKLDSDSIAKLTSIFGKDYSELQKEISAIHVTYGKKYTYTFKYVLECIAEVEKSIAEGRETEPTNPSVTHGSDPTIPGGDSGGSSSTTPGDSSDGGSSITPGDSNGGGSSTTPGGSSDGGSSITPGDSNGGGSSTTPGGSSDGGSSTTPGGSSDGGSSTTPSGSSGSSGHSSTGGGHSITNVNPNNVTWNNHNTSGGNNSGNTSGSGNNGSSSSSNGDHGWGKNFNDTVNHERNFLTFAEGYTKGMGYNGANKGIGLMNKGFTALGIYSTAINAYQNGRDPAKDVCRYCFGACGSDILSGTVGTFVADTLIGAGPLGVLSGIAAWEIGFVGTVIGETAFDCIDAFMNGELVNPFVVFWDNWVSDACDTFWPIFDILGIDKLVDWWDRSISAIFRVDPLIFDIAGDGFSIIDKSEGVYFDKDNNGYAERIDWTVSDSFLALDMNKNGKIDNGSELFGDTTYLNGEEKKYAENGFEALKQYDENGDGLITKEDSVFVDLKLWLDADGDGISTEDELTSLADHKIVAISAVADEEKVSTGTEAVIDGISYFEYEDGTKGRFGSLWATSNLYDTKEVDAEEIEGFDIGHIGNMPSLARALKKDDGTLAGYIKAFHSAESQEDKMANLDNILYVMSGAKDIASNSRGTNIDARKLHVIETIMGRSFTGVNGENPNPTAANILKNMYNTISNAYYSAFNAETVKPFLSYLAPYKDESGNTKIYSGFMCIKIYEELEKHPDSSIVADICKYLTNNQYTENTYDILVDINSFFSYSDKQSSAIRKELLSNGYYFGTNGNDTISGSGNDDIILGGVGSDQLYGGGGDDTYIYAKGAGNDVISDNSGKNKIIFKNIKSTDVYATFPGTGHDAVIHLVGSDETLTIRDFRYSSYYRNFTLVFEDKTIGVADTGSPFLDIRGTDSDEVMPMFFGNGTAYGMGGNDTMNGTNGNDAIYGGAGNDVIDGNNGDDILDGGSGDDKLYGGGGNDTYVYGKGYGNDIMSDNSGNNKIVFKGLNANDVYVTYPSTGHDAILHVIETGETLTIQDFRYSSYYRNFTLIFEDKTIGVAETGSPFLDIRGTNEDETIPMFFGGGSAYGYEGNDNINGTNGNDLMVGGAGNDVLNGNNGNDTLDGGIGNDELYGGGENDTYVYGKGYGNDVMSDNSGANTIIFKELNSTDLYVVYPSSGHDAILHVIGSDDTLTIKDFRYSSYYRNFTLVFEDKTVGVGEEGSPFLDVRGTENDETIPMFFGGGSAYGYEGDDNISGTNGNDLMVGGAGNDVLNGNNGEDTLDGGIGDDKLYGGGGNDTYVYGKGYGNDIMSDNSGKNRIVFKGLNTSDVYVVYPSTGHDAILHVIETGETLTIQDFRYSSYYRDFTLVFEDKTVGVGEEGSPFLDIRGTDEDETLPMFFGNGTAYGYEGDDVIDGTNSNDKIYGGAGNDIINGNNGADFLDGGTGNDELYGGGGDDIYVYGFDYGKDIISDNSGSNTIIFRDLNANDIYVVYPGTGHDAILHVIDSEDTLTIKDFRYSSYYRNFKLIFEDLTLDAGETGSPFLDVRGTSAEETIPMFFGGGSAHGYEGNDTINGTDGNDIIDGGADNDVLNGNNGNDVLDGGAGNDKLYGGGGDDTFVYGKGYGNDVISDNSGKNKILFKNLKPEELYVMYPYEGHDAIITVASTGETLTIKDFRYSSYYRDFTLEFADGQEMAINAVGSPFLNVVGTDKDEVFNSFYDNSKLYAFAGDDTINGSNGSDYMEGGAGNDILNGNNGNDTLDGGSGDDKLYGGGGNDIYVYGKNYGNDIMNDNSGKNTIVFKGLNTTDLYVVYPSSGHDAILTVAETGETLTIQDFRYSSYYRDFTLVFDDKTVGVAEEGSPFLDIRGTKVDETIPVFFGGGSAYGYEGDDNIEGSNGNDAMYGGSGNDIINGNNGDDTIDGGAGNDALNGGGGNDTYVYSKGYGNDTISDNSGSNTVIFKGLKSTDLYVTYPTSGHNAVLHIAETDETLTFVDFRYSSYYRDFTLIFDDITVAASAVGSPFLDVRGTEDSETIPMFFGNGSAYGYDGDDIINATNGNDSLYGGAGNDTINADNGNDVLDGDTGDDLLYGGGGDDRYVYGKGYGNDLISDNSGKNVLRLVGVKPSDIAVTYAQTGHNAFITIGSTGEVLTIQDFRYSSYYRNFTLVFDDETVAHINFDTAEIVIDKEGTSDTVEQKLTEYLSAIYSDDTFGGEFITDNTVISDVTESTSVSEKNDEIADMTNIQTMLLTENMSAFSSESQIYNGINVGDITADTSALDQLLINTSIQ